MKAIAALLTVLAGMPLAYGVAHVLTLTGVLGPNEVLAPALIGMACAWVAICAAPFAWLWVDSR